MKVIKVVTGEYVEDLTRNGWQLVATHENAQQFIEHRHMVRGAGYREGHSNWMPEEWKTEVALAHAPLFVLEKDAETLGREQELMEQIGRMNDAHAEDRRKLTEASKNLDTVAVAFENEKSARESAQRTNTALHEQIAEERGKLRKLEGDLAKVRKEIGEARWREVVG